MCAAGEFWSIVHDVLHAEYCIANLDFVVCVVNDIDIHVLTRVGTTEEFCFDSK